MVRYNYGRKHVHQFRRQDKRKGSIPCPVCRLLEWKQIVNERMGAIEYFRRKIINEEQKIEWLKGLIGEIERDIREDALLQDAKNMGSH